MSARDFDELLSAYLDGEVTAEERAVVERRLEQSPAAREALDDLSEIGELIRGMPRARPPLDLPERVLASIHTSPEPLADADGLRGRRGWSLAAAGLALAACVTIVLMLPSQRPADRNVALDAAPGGGAEPEQLAFRRGAAEDRSSGAVAEAAATHFDFGADVAQTESLTDLVNRLGRRPKQGEVLSRVVQNAGQTEVLHYTVVDTREVAASLKTIFASHRLDIVVTETASPRPAVVADAPAYFYVEGPPEQVDRALEQIRTLPVVLKADDYGLLAENTEPPETPLFADPQASEALRGGAAADALKPQSGIAGAAAGFTLAPAETLSRAMPVENPAPAEAPRGETASPEQSPRRESLVAQEPEPAAAMPKPASDSAELKALNVKALKEETRLGKTQALADEYRSGARGASAQLEHEVVSPIVERLVQNRATNQALVVDPNRDVSRAAQSNEPFGRENVGQLRQGQRENSLLRQQQSLPSVQTPVASPQLENSQRTLSANAAQQGAAPMRRAFIILENSAPQPAAPVAEPAGKKAD